MSLGRSRATSPRPWSTRSRWAPSCWPTSRSSRRTRPCWSSSTTHIGSMSRRGWRSRSSRTTWKTSRWRCCSRRAASRPRGGATRICGSSRCPGCRPKLRWSCSPRRPLLRWPASWPMRRAATRWRSSGFAKPSPRISAGVGSRSSCCRSCGAADGVFAGRLTDLDADARLAVTVVACDDRLDPGVVAQVCERLGADGQAGVAEAERLGLLRRESSRLALVHPLLRPEVDARLEPDLARAVHRAIADTLRRDGDLERRAWHLARVRRKGPTRRRRAY